MFMSNKLQIVSFSYYLIIGSKQLRECWARALHPLCRSDFLCHRIDGLPCIAAGVFRNQLFLYRRVFPHPCGQPFRVNTHRPSGDHKRGGFMDGETKSSHILYFTDLRRVRRIHKNARHSMTKRLAFGKPCNGIRREKTDMAVLFLSAI